MNWKTKMYFIVFQTYIRQQTTTNAYSRLQTFNQRLSLDKCCYFASSNRWFDKRTNRLTTQLKTTYLLITKHTQS